ncbi:MAG: hypothetical protein OXI87_24315 [Albidovulum sp.]|nr:hypothetical protein [Albidovulum sp.]MDE0307982.1 hypothetical protein [Albidovulum sp.]
MHCTWIVPEEPELSELRELVERLSAIGGGPSFEPHLTVLSGIRLEAGIVLELLAAAFERLPQFELEMVSTGTENAFFKSVYLLPKPSDRLANLRLRAEELLAPNSNSSRFNPHFSAAYGHFAAGRKKQMLELASRALPKTLRFERAMVVRASGAVPVEDWRPIGSIGLSGTGRAISRGGSP